jgi:hypothetical protein
MLLFFSYQHTLKKVYWYIIFFFSYRHTLKKVYWNVNFFFLPAHFYEWCCEPGICLCWSWRSVFVLLAVFRLLCLCCCLCWICFAVSLVLFPLVWNFLYVSPGTSCTLFLINLCLFQKKKKKGLLKMEVDVKVVLIWYGDGSDDEDGWIWVEGWNRGEGRQLAIATFLLGRKIWG